MPASTYGKKYGMDCVIMVLYYDNNNYGIILYGIIWYNDKTVLKPSLFFHLHR